MNSTQPDPENLAVGDFDEVGVLEYTDATDRVMIDSLVADDFTTFALNNQGLNFLNEQGWTKFAFRESHDLLDTEPPGPNEFFHVRFATNDYFIIDRIYSLVECNTQ